MPILLYTADVVCPMTGPPLAGAGVLVRDDTIVAVGDAPARWLRMRGSRPPHRRVSCCRAS
jgi:hypothetical protein